MSRYCSSPLRMFGGKWRMAMHIIPYIPDNGTQIHYVEVFGGCAHILCALPPRRNRVETYNDINGLLVNFFRVVRDNLDELINRLEWTLCSREEFYKFKEDLQNNNFKDDIDKALKFYYLMHFSYGSTIKNPSFGYSVSPTWHQFQPIIFQNKMIKLKALRERFSAVQIENLDWRDLLDKYDSKTTFFYLDPPYVPTTRKGIEYEFEMTIEEHEELVDRILQLDAKVMLSGYPNEIYKKLEDNGWIRKDFVAIASIQGNNRFISKNKKGNEIKKDRIESIWMNYKLKKNGTFF